MDTIVDSLQEINKSINVEENFDALMFVGADRNKTIQLMKEDLNFFASVVIPDIFTLLFPQIHKEVWALLNQFVDKPKTFFKLVLGLPRGHAKTTLIKLFVVRCILFSTKEFPLITSSTSTRAENVLADIFSMMKSQNIRTLFGNWESSISQDTQSIKQFMFAGRPIILVALGAGTGLRGLNIQNRRPDIIICDDIQTAEDKDSKEVADKLLTWMLGTLFMSKNPSGCLYIYIGNMFSGPNCILAKLKASKEYISFVVGAILADGTAIWPELHSLEDLVADLEHYISLNKSEIFFAEVQNDPDAGVSSVFNIHAIPDYPFNDNDLITGGCVIIDLSGDKPGSDDHAIGYFATIEHRNVFKDLESGQMSPLQAIQTAMQVAYRNNCPYIFIESTAYQASFLFWFNFVCTQNQITGFQLHEIYPREKKVKRILKGFKQLTGGDILLHPCVKTRVIYQASQYKPNKADNKDDILDLIGNLDFVLSDYAPLLATPINELLANLGNEAKTIENCCSV